MSTKASYPEWMAFYIRAQAQGAFCNRPAEIPAAADRPVGFTPRGTAAHRELGLGSK
jgi:hypothetical protein